MFERILFATDFSESADRALDYAVVLADSFDAELHILHGIVELFDDPGREKRPEEASVLEVLEQRAQTRLARLVGGMDLKKLRVVRTSRRGVDATVVILNYAAEVGADLVVMGSHGHSGAQKFFLGSVSERTLRRAEIPVLIVREGSEQRLPDPIRNILVPVDFHHNAPGAVDLALTLATKYAAAVRLLHVVDIPNVPAVYGLGMPIDPTLILDRVRDQLDELASQHSGSGVEIHCDVAVGAPVEAILAKIDQHGIDLVVIPPDPPDIFRLLSGVTDQLLRQASCPILTCPPEPKARTLKVFG